MIMSRSHLLCVSPGIPPVKSPLCPAIRSVSLALPISIRLGVSAAFALSPLLQRLGLPEENYYAFLGKNELEIEALKKEIMGCNIAEKKDECAAALQKLRALSEPDDLPTQQFILRSQALLSRLKGGTPQEELTLLHQAMHLTNPGFALDRIGQFLYTFEEVKLLNQIALCYSDLGEHTTALDIYSQLLDYIQQHYPQDRKSVV